MANTYYAVYVHIVFSTKNRERWLSDRVCAELFPYLGGIVTHQKCLPITVGGYTNHVHILTRTRATTLVAEIVKEAKRGSTSWLNEHGVAYGKFSWQIGYGAFSVSYWDLEKVKLYIQNQKEHHKVMSWEEEYKKLLNKHGIDFDERYFLD